MHPHESLIRRYFAACNAGDHDALVACFTPDAVHYFPPGLPGIPWRGDEWYVFDCATGLIKEIRAYYAAPAVKNVPIGELVDFDYAGRGYHSSCE